MDDWTLGDGLGGWSLGARAHAKRKASPVIEVPCVRCSTVAEIRAEVDGAELPPKQAQHLAAIACSDKGWGIAGRDENAALLCSCPEHATLDELQNAARIRD